MSKKTFYLILIIVAGLLIIGGLIWYFIFKPSTPLAPASSVDFTVPDQVKNGAKIKALSKGPVISARLDGYGILWYYDYSGRLWQFSGDGTIEYNDSGDPIVVDQPPIENLLEIIWPKVFSPDGKKIVYQKSNVLFTSDSSGKNQRTLISDLKLRDVILQWPNANNIALVSKPSGLAVGGLWYLDIRNLSINKVIGDFFGLEILFSPDGNSFIYSYTDQNGQNPKLAIYNKKGEKKNLNNTSTVIDKCAWASDSINVFCAVPKNWPEGMVLPDDYYKKVNLTLDDVWKINIETDEKTLIAKDVGDISNLAVSKDESNLFFVLKENQFLYKLIIK